MPSGVPSVMPLGILGGGGESSLGMGQVLSWLLR